mmetsp:Transcript_31169/g.85405  ORF Transcript_31169/g.85405 Transcript_31169/m.85405 type:complete len:228 (-) Transcript_31169:331-1014(-)
MLFLRDELRQAQPLSPHVATSLEFEQYAADVRNHHRQRYRRGSMETYGYPAGPGGCPHEVKEVVQPAIPSIGVLFCGFILFQIQVPRGANGRHLGQLRKLVKIHSLEPPKNRGREGFDCSFTGCLEYQCELAEEAFVIVHACDFLGAAMSHCRLNPTTFDEIHGIALFACFHDRGSLLDRHTRQEGSHDIDFEVVVHIEEGALPQHAAQPHTRVDECLSLLHLSGGA